MEPITFDDDGNCIGANLMDHLIPTAWETPEFELGEMSAPPPPDRGRSAGESATVGSPAAYVNAVIDALGMACGTSTCRLSPDKVWALAEGGPRGVSDVLIEAGRLSEAGEQYVLATVVSVRRPALGQAWGPCGRALGREARRLGRRRRVPAGGYP